MGLFWDLFQQVQIHKRKNESTDLDSRVSVLEEELAFTQEIRAQALEKPEEITDQEFNN